MFFIKKNYYVTIVFCYCNLKCWAFYSNCFYVNYKCSHGSGGNGVSHGWGHQVAQIKLLSLMLKAMNEKKIKHMLCFAFFCKTYVNQGFTIYFSSITD